MWAACTTAAGIRIFGTSVTGFDFSLNYANIPQAASGTYNITDVGVEDVYGDADVAQKLGLAAPVGTFEQGLRRCLNNRGSQGNARNDPSQAGDKCATALVGADLNGYNNPARYRRNNKNGILDNNGEPLPGRHGAVRAPITHCLPFNYHNTRTHVIGFTSTYNDFEYTGAVFRLEQSFSTKEHVRKLGVGFGRNKRPRTVVQDRTSLPANLRG